MAKQLDERIKELLMHGTPGQRLYACEKNPVYFAIYYFSEYFTHKIAPFHFDFYDDCRRLASGELEEAAWIAFRESAKTSIAKIAAALWMICYKKKKFINYDSYDKENSEAALFDIAVALQTNKKLIADFGQLYHRTPKPRDEKESQIKRLSNFITENGVKVEAYSTQESTRGRIYKNSRPDFYIVDDFENSKTKDSYPIIRKIKAHLDEMKSGLGPNGSILYLGNYITEEGVVSSIIERVRQNPKGVVRNIPVVMGGVISWPDKYVATNAEAVAVNALIPNLYEHKISLEARRASLGDLVFETEMLNNPAHGSDKLFDRGVIERKLLMARPPTKVLAGLKLWADYNPAHRYAIGADTAKGVGKDSNASAIIDCSTIPNRVVGTYKNNLIAPDIFAHELKRQGDMFGTCLLAPERNNTGYATITKLKDIYPTTELYVPLQNEKVKEKLSDEFGFETNAATKPEIIYQLKTAVEDGLLEILDEQLLEELKYYSQKDLKEMRLIEGMTRHFDLLMALAIAWAVRTHAKITKAKKPFRQGTYQSSTEFGG